MGGVGSCPVSGVWRRRNAGCVDIIDHGRKVEGGDG
jgi:hypothetical protein